MFVGRESELKKLNQMYLNDKFEFGVFYGRRRVGKTTLINEFCKDKKTVFFVSVEATAKENLENLSKAIFETLSPNITSAIFESFEKAIEYIFDYAKKEKIIFVIDEYPYLAESYKSISSILQKHIDANHENSNLFLILCGSSMSFMEYKVLGYKSPLYGRRTAQFKILPFTYFESTKMLTDFTNEEKAILYGITGGVPEYLSRIDNNMSMQDNIIELFLTTSGRLFEEPSNLLKQELREPQLYNSIITAIAKGASKLNQIATKVGIETGQCSNLLSVLISLGIVRKDIPVTEINSRKTTYVLEDLMFKFWYRFVGPNLNSVVSGFGERVFDEIVSQELSDYMGPIFEEISRQYLLELMKRDEVPFFFGRIGRWWGNNKKEKREEEIDILAFSDEKAIFGECKWSNSLINLDVYDKLVLKSKLFTFKESYYYLFSKSGFTQKLISETRDNQNIKLISFEDMNFFRARPLSGKRKGNRSCL